MHRDGPLSGVRVIDMGWSWAGPYGGMILADLGAEVIKLESAHRIDILRWSGAFTDMVRHHERSGYYTACNRGKLSATLNLKDDAAKELLLRLVETADALIENFAPRVLPGLGLGADVLQARNPKLVVLSMSGYGATGPERDNLSYGDHLLHASGIASVTGHPDDPHTKIGTFYGDPVGGMYGALSIIAGLAERDRTGKGVRLELSQLEGLISLIPAHMLRASAGASEPRSADKVADMCPHGFYRCIGQDAWVSIAVRSDVEWDALRALLIAANVDAPIGETLAERKAEEDAIDAAVSAWTGQRSPWEVVRACQAHGIAAYPVQSAPRLLYDDHLHAREFFQWVNRPINGPGPIPGVTFRIAGGGSAVRGYAPLLGEHNDYVWRDVVGLPEDEYNDLRARQVIA
jgi:crotonobetainyl-CoA:carnitine CoA-transferase CaiB-like acyl-CoA transferase